MPANFQNDLLLITGASGRQTSHVLSNLSGKWKNLRLAVNSEDSEVRLKKQYSNQDVVRGDLLDPTFVKRIMIGVTAVFHVGPGFHPHESTMGYNMIDAAVEEAKGGNFKHFVYSSVLCSQLRKMMNHDVKRFVEEYLMESGLNYSIIQPAHFMDLFPIPMLLLQSNPTYKANWDPSVPFSFLALRDLGEVVAKILTERENHYFAQYPLVSDGPMPYTEVVQQASKAIGKEIKIEQNSYQNAVNTLLMRLLGTTEVSPRARDGPERMLLFYNRRGLIGNSNVLEWLLGRKPTSHEEWQGLAVAQAQQK